MNIAFIAQPWNDCPTTRIGSISTWIYEVGRRLSRLDDVLVYTREIEGRPNKEFHSGMTFHRISNDSDEQINWYLHRLNEKGLLVLPPFSSFFFHAVYAVKIAIDLRGRQCDIVHIHNLLTFAPIIKLLNPRVKIVLHMHCEWLSQLPSRAVRRRLRKVSHILGCSDYIVHQVNSRFPDLSEKTDTIYNGVDIDHFHPASTIHEKNMPSHQKVILFVGRLSPEKGLHVLLDAFLEVARKVPDVQLRIVGEESVTPRQYIVDLSRDNDKLKSIYSFYKHNMSYVGQLIKVIPARMKNDIVFLGYVGHDDLPAQYQSADVLVNPSLSESFGMALIEAMSCGIPVIATRVGGMTEILQHKFSGLLVDSNDSSALADSIVKLLRSKKQRVMMGDAGRRRVEESFSWEEIAGKLQCVYKKIS